MSFKYAYREIMNKFIITVLLIVQLAFAFFSIYNILQVNKKISNQAGYIGSFFESKKIYNISFLESPGDYLGKSRGKEKEVQDILDYLANNSKFKFINLESNPIYPEIFNGYEAFASNSHNVDNYNKTFFPALNITVNKIYLKTYPLKIMDGRTFDKGDFERSNTTEIIPVIVGNNYSNYFKVGEEKELLVGNEKFKIKIIGILSKDQYTIGQLDSIDRKYTNLNNMIISPNSIYQSSILEMFGVLCPGNYILFDEHISDKQIENEFKEIERIFEEKINTKINVINLNKYISSESNSYKEQLKISFLTAIVIIVCLSFTLIISILDSINKRKSEFAVHIFSGGRLKDISLTIYLQIFITFIIGFILSIPLIKVLNDNKTLNIQCLLYLFVIGVLFSIILSVIPIMKLSRISISDLIKGDE